MAFRSNPGFRDEIVRRLKAIHVNSVSAVHGSLTEGSAITGAPGQPVQTEFLKGSIQPTFPEEWRALVTTNTEYGPAIEAGQQEPYFRNGKLVTPRPMRLLSEVGGFHSFALTRSNWPLLVEDVVQAVVGT